MGDAYSMVSSIRFWELAQSFFLFLQFLAAGLAVVAVAFFMMAD